jgi:hypothetical protein
VRFLDFIPQRAFRNAMRTGSVRQRRFTAIIGNCLTSGWATTQDQSREPKPKIEYPATARPWMQVVTGVDAQGRAVGNNVVRERQ